ncbi:hypothetical protein [Azospirillum sp. B510]|uniref:hypothetical protein n=1 Tax=Azospirillum sp. (strain B510) TaxID=137722 RepID=UPI0011D11874|nr:hypothetical protein [Azospirillum sp. B510]
MARVVHMGKLGGHAALLGGALLELEGRILWSSASGLTEALVRAGIASSSLIIDTRSPAGAGFGGVVGGTVREPAARFRSDARPLAA